MSDQKNDTLGGATLWIKTCLPEPSDKDFHTQLGVFSEEVGETLLEVAALDKETGDLLLKAINAMSQLGNHLKKSQGKIFVGPYSRQAFLDGLCDVGVTISTTAYTQQLDLVGAMHEVNRANFSKFVNGVPIFNENHKVAKGPDYIKPDLSSFV